MICSEILLVLVLVVLAWMVWLLMSGDKFTNTKEKFASPKLSLENDKLKGQFDAVKRRVEEQRMVPQDIAPVVGPSLEPFTASQNLNDYVHQPVEHFEQYIEQPVEQPVEHFEQYVEQPVEYIQYETFANEPVANEQMPEIKYDNVIKVSGYSDDTHDAAPFKGASLDDAKYVSVKYSGLVDGKSGEAVQIEGTDLLSAPLVDNMLYTNSIANINRNASQDLRGDIPVQFNASYTPFYSSTIYGAPLSQHGMQIGTV